MESLCKNGDNDKDVTVARPKKLSAGSLPPPVKLIEESDLLQQSLYQGAGAGTGQNRHDQGGLRTPVKSKTYPAYNKCTVQAGDADETESTYSSAYSSKSDSVTPADSFSELSDGSFDDRASRHTTQTSPVASAGSSPAHCAQQPDSELVPKKVKAWTQALGGWTFTGVTPYPQSPKPKEAVKPSQEVRIPASTSALENPLVKSENNSPPTNNVDEKEEVTPPSSLKQPYPLGKFVRRASTPTAAQDGAAARKTSDTQPPKAAATNPPHVEQKDKQKYGKPAQPPVAPANSNPPVATTTKTDGTTSRDTIPPKVAAKPNKRSQLQDNNQLVKASTSPAVQARPNPPMPLAKGGAAKANGTSLATVTAVPADNAPCTERAQDKQQAAAVKASPLDSAQVETQRSVISQESFFNKSSAWASAMKKSEELAKARQTAAEPKPPEANNPLEEPTDLDQRAKAFGGVRRPATVRRTQSMFVRPTTEGNPASGK